jgi:CHAT domain-containing protein
MPLSQQDRLNFVRAETALSQGRYHEAQAALQSYLTGRLEAVSLGDAYVGADAVAIERLADLSTYVGAEQAAEELIEGLCGLYHRAGNFLCERIAILRLAHLELKRGDIRQTRDTLQRLEPWSGPIDDIVISQQGLRQWERRASTSSEAPGDQSAGFALWYMLLGRLCAATGCYGEANVAYLRGLEHSKAPEARHYTLGLQLSRAQTLLECGELDSALKLANGIQENVIGSIAALEIVAKACLMAGRLGEAKSSYENAISQADGLQLNSAGSSLRLNLAHLLILLNQIENAERLIRHANQLAVSAAALELQQRANVLSHLARIRRSSQTGDSAIAPSVLELQMEAFEPKHNDGASFATPLNFPSQESYLGTLEDRLTEWQNLLAQDGIAAAENMLPVIDAFTNSDSPVVNARVAVARGLLAYFRRRTSDARNHFHVAESILVQGQLLLELRQLRRYQGWCMAKMGNARALEEYRHEESSLLDRLAPSLAVADQGLFWLNKWTADEEALAADLKRLSGHQAKMFSKSRWLRFLGRVLVWWNMGPFLQKLDDHRQARLRQALDLNTSDRQPRRFSWINLFRFPRDRAIVSFLVLPDRVFVGCMWSFGADFRVSPVSRIEIRDSVRQFHRCLVENRDDQQASQTLTNLVRSLGLQELFSRLPARVRAVAFIPDDALLGIPFSVIPVGEKLVLDHWAVSNAFSWYPKKESRVINSSLLVTVPNPGGGMRPLDQADREVATVKEICGLPDRAVIQLQDGDARREAVVESLSRASMWHTACHGVFKPEAPGSAGIVLQAENGQGPEVLTLRDLSALDLHRIRLAVLASCWSSDNFVSPGRWILSLPYTLCAAGAQTIVGSLWEALDEISLQFMRVFYEQLRNGEACDQAFRSALLSCRTDAKGDRRPMWDWAGFVLVGNAEPAEWRTE